MDWNLLVAKIQAGDEKSLAFCITLFCVIGCVFSICFQYRVWRWPFVWGELIEAGIEKAGGTDLVKSEQDYIANTNYTYTVGSKEYTGKRISAMAIMASHNARGVLARQLKGIEISNNKVKVYYNPKNPQKSYLIRGSVFQVVFTAAMLLGMLAVSYRLLEMAKII